MKAFLVLLAGMLALAGCSSSPDDGEDGGGGGEPLPAQRPEVPDVDPFPEDAAHDHGDAAQHQFLWNYEFAQHDPLLSNAANMAGLHAIDLQAGHLFGAVYGSHALAVDGGVVIWDLSDPAQPQETGRWVIPGAVGGDRSIGATSDGSYAVVATEPLTCFGQLNPAAGLTAYLIDATDKSLPHPVDAVTVTGQSRGTTNGPLALGTHSVEVANINGTDYAFLQGQIYRIDRDEAQASLVHVSTVNVGHDLYVRQTPWGDTWGLSAGGGSSFQLFDLSDPANPEELSNWDVPDRGSLDGSRYLHTADVAFFDDGQTLIVLTSEDWEPHPSPFWILDATDPSELQLVGEWTNPWNKTAQHIHFSQHNPRFHDGVLSLSHYHGGVVQLDFRDPSFRADPALVGYAVYAAADGPANHDPQQQLIEAAVCGLAEPSPVGRMDAPLAMDVEVGANGTLYVADVTGGLYTFTPSETHPVYGAPENRILPDE